MTIIIIGHSMRNGFFNRSSINRLNTIQKICFLFTKKDTDCVWNRNTISIFLGFRTMWSSSERKNFKIENCPCFKKNGKWKETKIIWEIFSEKNLMMTISKKDLYTNNGCDLICDTHSQAICSEYNTWSSSRYRFFPFKLPFLCASKK